jgi:glutamyl-tRNA reductase
MNDVVEVGVDQRTAPLAVRERIAVPGARVPEVLRALAAEPFVAEAMLVSTCNRTEAYVVAREPDAAPLLLAALRRHLPAAPAEDDPAWAARRGEDATLHLLRVAAGLESAILGETEVLGQVREAHRVASEAGTVGPVLDRLARSALHAGKRVRTDTPIARGALSHGQAAYEVARRVFGGLRHRTVLVVGAGEMARLAATAIAALEGGTFVVANRTREHGEALAAGLPSSTVASLDDVPSRLAEAHVAVFAGGDAPLSKAQVEAAVARRRDPLLLLDYGVPRLVDPRATDVPGVFLWDLEAVEALVAKSLAARREAVPAAEALVHEELAGLRAWARTLRAVPAIRSLHAWAEDVRRGELAQLPADTPSSTRAAVEEITRRLVERLLRRPAARVRRGVEEGDPALPTPDHLRNLFGLPEGEGPSDTDPGLPPSPPPRPAAPDAPPSGAGTGLA